MKEKLLIGASSRFHTAYPGGSYSPIEMIEHFHKGGFRAIDFDIATVPEMGENWKKTLGEAVELAAKYGIRMDYGHLPFKPVKKPDGSNDKELFNKRMMLSIEAAGFAGIKNAVIHPAKNKPGEDGFKKNIECLTPYAEQAQKFGVRLTIENMRSAKEAEGYHRYSSVADEVIELADYFDADICWDFGHSNTTGLYKQSEELKKIGKRLAVLHVNDNHGGEDEHLPPFLGNIDWLDAVEGLRAAGYTGVFNYECKMMRLPKDAATREGIAAYMIGVGNYLTDLIAKE